MKALLLTDLETFEWRDVDLPEAPADWVRVRMQHVGICGSDLHYYVEGRIGDQRCTFPHILGHEGCGEVLEGAGHFEKGTPVYFEPAIACHQCDQCRAGRENTCRRLTFFGNPNETPGCMREEIALPPENVFTLPEVMSPEEGFLLEPLCIGVYAVQRSHMPKGGTAAVVGSGPIGLSVLLGLSDYEPAEVYVTDPVPERRQAAERLGATKALDPSPVETGSAKEVYAAAGGGVDVAFECAATEESIEDAIHMLKPGGTLALVGIPESFDRMCFDHSHMRRNEITLVNIRRQNQAIEQALPLLERRRDFKDVMITHHFPITEAKKAFELVRERRDGVIKAVLDL